MLKPSPSSSLRASSSAGLVEGLGLLVGASLFVVGVGCTGLAVAEGEGEGDAAEGEGEGEGEGDPGATFCGVRDLFAAKCTTCHDGSTFPDLREAALADLVGLQSELRPDLVEVVAGDSAASFLVTKISSVAPGDGALMPVGGTLSDAQIAAVAGWIDAGASTSCDVEPPPPPDPIVESTAPFGYDNSPPAGDYSGGACTTDQYWVFGDAEANQMRPGDDCRGCHISEGEGPVRDTMGTVFLGLHDATNCRGASPSNYQILVDIMDEAGTLAYTMDVNSGGNFFSGRNDNAPNPYTAQVRLLDVDGNEVSRAVMATPQTEGSCNSCHTETASGPIEGNTPLGRITIAP